MINYKNVIVQANPLSDFGLSARDKTLVSEPSDPVSPKGTLEGGNVLDLKAVNVAGVVCWSELSKGMFMTSPAKVDRIPAAVYRYVCVSSDRNAFVQQPINVDELLNMPDSLCDSILKEVQQFINNENNFKYYNVLHRRGYLFYGMAGGGKSSLVQQIIHKIIKQDGVVLLCGNPTLLEAGLQEFRKVEPDRFIVCLYEDIDALIRVYGESKILSVLDGESQINKVLNIATTNYPELLDKRIVGRPRRFDRVIKIDYPTPAVRRHYFKHKLKLEEVELDNWVNATDRFTFAAMAELLISVKCLGKNFDEAVKILRELQDTNCSSADFSNGTKVGFGIR